MTSFFHSVFRITLISAGMPATYALAADPPVQPQGQEKTFKT
jgi:hypothetical protein